MRTILTFLVTIIVIGCNGQININDYIDSSRPIQLTIDDKTDSVAISNTPKLAITVDDERFKDLISWGNQNLDKWKSAPASYVMADVYITQDDFQLCYWKSGFVVVQFKDKKGRQRQMTKKLKGGEFSFIFK